MDLREYCRGVRGIIFDYGGTLDSRGDHWSEVILRGWHHVLGAGVERALFRDAYVEGERAMARERIIMPEDDFRTTLYKKIRVELAYYFDNGGDEKLWSEPGYPNREYAIEELAGKIADYCDGLARDCIQEAKRVLEELKRSYPMVLVSNFYGNVESVLKTYDVARYFDSVIESAVVGVRKPDPAIFRLGVEALGLEPSEVVVIGDTYKKDISPALTLGCKAIWIKGKGWTEAEDAREYPYIIHSLDQLSEALKF